MDAKVQIQDQILSKVPENETGTLQQELEEYKNTARRYGIHAEDVDNSENDDVNYQQLQGIINGEMKTLLSDVDACSRSQAERAAIYAEYDAGVETKDKFREDLLKHLAGSIVIKEHKIRYQKEQFDRFVASMNFYELKNNDQSLAEFSQAYSRLVNAHTQSSHNYRCHKIDANYDDFGEQTIKPLNATIFFYFFSANRSGKTWAQWMLSSASRPT